jgi:hypothetical protein
VKDSGSKHSGSIINRIAADLVMLGGVAVVLAGLGLIESIRPPASPDRAVLGIVIFAMAMIARMVVSN